MPLHLNLDKGAQSLVVLAIELVFDLYHVHLTARHHHTNQVIIICTQTLQCTNENRYRIGISTNITIPTIYLHTCNIYTDLRHNYFSRDGKH